jgi:DNA-binding IclR family transcriptional regulator
LTALVESGLLQQDPVSERYALGADLAVLGARASRTLGLSAARPVLVELSEATGESVNLGMREAGDVLVALAVPSTQPLRFEQVEGSRVPLHASAMGKVLLAFAPDGAGVDQLGRLERLTGSTITSKAVLRRAVAEARTEGWALNDEEREPGVRTVAVPVLASAGVAMAAIAVQGPTTRMTHDRVEQILPELEAAARAVAERMTPDGAVSG